MGGTSEFVERRRFVVSSHPELEFELEEEIDCRRGEARRGPPSEKDSSWEPANLYSASASASQGDLSPFVGIGEKDAMMVMNMQTDADADGRHAFSRGLN